MLSLHTLQGLGDINGREQALHLRCRLLLHASRDVGVGVERQRDVCVSQYLLHYLGADSLLQQERGAAMTQIVGADVR